MKTSPSPNESPASMFVEQAGVVLYLTSTLVYIPGFVLFNPLETRVFHMTRAFGEGSV